MPRPLRCLVGIALAAALIPHALIPIGYAAKDPVRRDRLPLDRLIASWE